MITVAIEVGGKKIETSLAELETLFAELADFFGADVEEEDVEPKKAEVPAEEEDDADLEAETAPDDEEWP